MNLVEGLDFGMIETTGSILTRQAQRLSISVSISITISKLRSHQTRWYSGTPQGRFETIDRHCKGVSIVGGQHWLFKHAGTFREQVSLSTNLLDVRC